ncbi:Hypothetical protein SRAE_1000256400 [Strongyloides ratti]|uniref:Uncharacterized protein n=1 Tax=Strongyloides ratti TaxID=34506 RepID=A0A090MWU8_STRRB|nr:Hypothetical protein SRAE_1000256400 [Strongyloides ratti]CEF64309.1 Hypothetical protein SRAE_1000256400 [Strongyloides ratti]
MFLDSKQFTTFWFLLFQIFTYCKESTYENLFPLVPKNINQNTFPVKLTSASISDVVIVRCPTIGYKHNHVMDVFLVNNVLKESDLVTHGDRFLFNWIIWVYKKYEPGWIDCGIITTKSNIEMHDRYFWKYKLKWQSQPNPFMVAKWKNISTHLPYPHNCSNNQQKILIFTKNKEDRMIQLNLIDNRLKTPDAIPYVNKLYYFFIRPDDNDRNETKEPCMIFRAYNDIPEIIIEGYNPNIVKFNNLEIGIIKLDHMKKFFNIQLVIRNKPELKDFYKNDEIFINKVKFTKEKVEEILSSSKTFKSFSSLQGYQLVNFTYNCPTPNNTNKIIKTYYFAPPKENYEFPLEQSFFPINKPAFKPNCSINQIDYGYFYSVNLNGKTVLIDELNINGVEKHGLIRSGEYIFTSKIEQFNTTLRCTYKTLNGQVIIVKSFIAIRKIINNLDQSWKKIFDRNDINKNRKKMIYRNDSDEYFNEESKKSDKTWYEKLKKIIENTWIYTILGGIIFVVLATIIIATVQCFLKLSKEKELAKRIKKKSNFSRSENILETQKDSK